MPRITRISGSLAIVLIAYWAYALMAVPWIEPTVAQPVPISVGPVGPRRPDPSERQIEEIRPLFQPKDWELDVEKTKVLEGDRAKLLFQKYDNRLGGGKVILSPCTIIFLSDGPAENDSERIRQSIVLQAKEAILQFEHDLQLSQPGDANLLGGQFVGDIIIRSDWKKPGPEDDLLILAKNVQLSKESISTPEQVRFSWGPHFGSGREMTIKLLPGKPGGGAMDVGGIASFELRHIDRLHLEAGPDGQKLMGVPSKPAAEGGASPAAGSASSSSTPVEIACSGPFLFDVTRRVATFHDNVRVVKANATG